MCTAHPKLKSRPGSLMPRCWATSTASALASSMLQHLPTDQQKHLVVREAFLRRLPLDICRVIEEDESLDIRRLAKAADRRLKGRTLPPMTGPPADSDNHGCQTQDEAGSRPEAASTRNQPQEGAQDVVLAASQIRRRGQTLCRSLRMAQLPCRNK